MEAKTEHARTAASAAAQTTQQGQPTPPDIDYSPKKMTPRETLILSLKLAGATAIFLALLWLAHVKLDR